ncbi:MAG: SPFH domain-containing protein, partial [Planctomycetota bacterium]
MDIRFEPRKLPIPITTIVAVVCVLIVGLFSMRLGQVKASQVGILINNVSGKYEVILNPGKFFYNGLLSALYTMDKTRRTLKMLSTDGEEVRIKTSDGSDVNLDVEINYEILKDSKTIASKILPEAGVKKISARAGSRRRGPASMEEAYQSVWIRDYSRAVVRYIFGNLTTIEFYEAAKRDDKARETERELNRLLEPHGIRVTKVVPDKFRFYEEYERKIREKKEADQEKEKQKELAKAALKSQEYKVVEADKAAEVEIERTRGTLKKQLIAAEAE